MNEREGLPVEESVHRAQGPGKESDMGMWIELGIFILVIVFALWQIQDVKKARAKTQAHKARQADQGPDSP